MTNRSYAALLNCGGRAARRPAATFPARGRVAIGPFGRYRIDVMKPTFWIAAAFRPTNEMILNALAAGRRSRKGRRYPPKRP